jgi:hypothetical protein
MLRYIKNNQSLEAELKLNNSSMVLSELLKEALEQSKLSRYIYLNLVTFIIACN